MGLGKILVMYVTSEYWRGVIKSVNVPETDTSSPCQACNLRESEYGKDEKQQGITCKISGMSFQTCLYYSHRL